MIYGDMIIRRSDGIYWGLGKLGAYPELTRFLSVACSYYLLLDLYMI